MPTPEREAYDRGKTEGELAAKVAEQGTHLDKINGSMEKVAERLGDLVQGQQRLEQRMAADERTRIATAEALQEAEDARRQSESEKQQAADKRWSPLARLSLLVGVLVGLVTLLALLANHAF